MSNFPKFTIKQMLENGVHFGHKSMLWNPKMSPYIYCERNGVHIINLQKTAQLLHESLYVVYQTIRKNPKAKILFVGTKHQASSLIRKYAMHCGQFFVDHRWLGGMLTNWNTVSKSIKKLADYEKLLAEEATSEGGKYSKKELLEIDRSREKLDRSLGGIREMRQKPDLVFIIDTNKEKIAVQESKKLGIPVMAVLDTNSNIENVNYPIPGNDDSSKSVGFYCDMLSQATICALEDALVESGIDPSEAKTRVREAIDKDNQRQEEKKIDFAKVQEAKAQIEKTQTAKKRVLEVNVGDFVKDEAQQNDIGVEEKPTKKISKITKKTTKPSVKKTVDSSANAVEDSKEKKSCQGRKKIYY